MAYRHPIDATVRADRNAIPDAIAGSMRIWR